MTDNLFALLFLLPLPVWIAMLIFPRRNFTYRVVTSPWPFIILGGVYTLFLLLALPGVLSGIGISAGYLQALLLSEWGFLALWAHLQALNLFVAVWIFRDARYWGIATLPYLLLSLFTGPLALGLYHLLRRRKEAGDPIRNLN